MSPVSLGASVASAQHAAASGRSVSYDPQTGSFSATGQATSQPSRAEVAAQAPAVRRTIQQAETQQRTIQVGARPISTEVEMARVIRGKALPTPEPKVVEPKPEVEVKEYYPEQFRAAAGIEEVAEFQLQARRKPELKWVFEKVKEAPLFVAKKLERPVTFAKERITKAKEFLKPSKELQRYAKEYKWKKPRVGEGIAPFPAPVSALETGLKFGEAAYELPTTVAGLPAGIAATVISPKAAWRETKTQAARDPQKFIAEQITVAAALGAGIGAARKFAFKVKPPKPTIALEAQRAFAIKGKPTVSFAKTVGKAKVGKEVFDIRARAISETERVTARLARSKTLGIAEVKIPGGEPVVEPFAAGTLTERISQKQFLQASMIGKPTPKGIKPTFVTKGAGLIELEARLPGDIIVTRGKAARAMLGKKTKGVGITEFEQITLPRKTDKPIYIKIKKPKQPIKTPKDVKFTQEQSIEITKTLRKVYGEQKFKPPSPKITPSITQIAKKPAITPQFGLIAEKPLKAAVIKAYTTPKITAARLMGAVISITPKLSKKQKVVQRQAQARKQKRISKQAAAQKQFQRQITGVRARVIPIQEMAQKQAAASAQMQAQMQVQAQKQKVRITPITTPAVIPTPTTAPLGIPKYPPTFKPYISELPLPRKKRKKMWQFPTYAERKWNIPTPKQVGVMFFGESKSKKKRKWRFKI